MGDVVPVAVLYAPPFSEYLYPVMGYPFAAPARKATDTDEAPAVTPVMVGGAGVVKGTLLSLELESTEVPMLVTVRIITEYPNPLVSPAIVNAPAETLAVE